MAWPWLVMAAKSIPWTTLIRRSPEIIGASAALLRKRKTGQPEQPRTTPSEPKHDELLGRLKNLEVCNRENAEVVEQIAEQVQDLTRGIEVLAARQRVLLVIVLAATVLASVGVVVAIL